VTVVLDAERAGPAVVSVTVLSSAAMRGLNRRTLGRDRATDVIAFGLAHPGRLVGDIYICPEAARRLRAPGTSEREELLRVLVHGTLHVLGYDHPDGRARTTCAMWRRQERYVRRLIRLHP
jgi:probable rRNA maturation factor